MYISQQDFEQIKSELIWLYRTARNEQDFYVAEEADFLLQKLQQIEVENIKKKSLLK